MRFSASGALLRLERRLSEPVSALPLSFFRVVLGAVTAAKAVWFMGSGQAEALYVGQAVHFPYPGFAWVRPLPGDWMYLPFAAMFASGIALALGWRARAAAAAAFASFTYVFLIDQSYYQNHDYLLSLLLLLMILVPSAGMFSVDARRRPSSRRTFVPRLAVGIFRFQIAVVYVFAGLAKLDPDWLSGAPMRIGLASRAQTSILGGILDVRWAPEAFTFAGLLFDLLIVPALLWRRTRAAATIASIAFHLMVAATFGIDVFPWLMIGATLALFAPDAWRERAAAAIRRRAQASPPAPERTAAALPRTVFALAAAYAAVQIALPLRHVAYPGSVTWTEEGHRYAWRMMLRTKRGEARFTVVDPKNGEMKTVHPARFLNPMQARKLAGSPELVLRTARLIAGPTAGADRPRVFADVLVELNGRAPRYLVDPTVDLAAVRPTLGPADWIVPFDPASEPSPASFRSPR
jgi:hypothetical protein